MVMKRIIAYFIDMIIVVFAASLLASISYLNPQLDEYNKVYNEFVELEKEMESTDSNSYLTLLANNDEKIKDINYQMDKYNIYGAIISIVITIAYFAIFQKYNGGQTLGKKIMKIKIQDGLSLYKYILRATVLNNIWLNVLKLVLIFTASKSNYITASNIIYVLAFMIELSIFLMVVLRKDKKGLHDIIAGSNVVEIVKKVEEK